MTLPPAELSDGSTVDVAGQRQFKKHKVLPRPQNERGRDSIRRSPKIYHSSAVTAASSKHASRQSASPQILKHQLKRIGTGPDLPPTPPTHSRASSSSHSAIPSSPTSTETSVQLPQVEIKRPPATPPDQRSPPTPDVTPPHPATLAKALRPTMKDRDASKVAPELRTESFEAAREDVISSDDEATRSAMWLALASSIPTSQATITQISETVDARAMQQQALDVTLKQRLNRAPKEDSPPRPKGRAGRFDDDWGAAAEVEHSRDARLQRILTSTNPRPVLETPRVSERRGDVIEDNLVSPTSAAKAVRNMPLKEAASPLASPQHRSDRKSVASSDLKRSESQTSAETRKPSSASTRSASNVSTSNMVEVCLMDGPPRRQRTLRHVRKQTALREPGENQTGSTAKKVDLEKSPNPSIHTPQLEALGRQESHISATTNITSRSISSGRARREVWKSGGIPVVVVPSRRSSQRGKSREPSLRSTSSRRSKRTASVGSSPFDSPPMDAPPVFERPPRRSRAYSESDRSERTIDFPPAIPPRSSSLSAPTSRNISRAGSMTASSIKIHTVQQQQSDPHWSQEVHVIGPSPPPEIPQTSPDTRELEREEMHDTLGIDRQDDVLSVKKYSSRNTPFSVASMETCGTAPELSEALAVHMYPHQNSSVLMVDHSHPGRPSDMADTQEEAGSLEGQSQPPKILRTSPDEQVPVTPPQQRFTLEDVDSPLRNPRAPPQPPRHPPAINFIPATPSGKTPDHEKGLQRGNYFETLKEKPHRRPSIVKRAFSRRRHSVDFTPRPSAPGFLTRTFSLSRNARKGSDSDDSKYRGDEPAEEDKLHPFWRPQWMSDEEFDRDEDEADDDIRREDEVYRYPPVDNRPGAPTRSLSAKIKKTFAILPPREYSADDVYGPQRRTIRRTPSGNLRVMKRRASSESLKRRSKSYGTYGNARSVSDGAPQRGIWRSQSLSRGGSVKKSRRFSIGSKLEEIQNLPQLLSDRRREKRSQQLRQMISGPREVRDGVGEVIRRGKAGVQHGVAGHF